MQATTCFHDGVPNPILQEADVVFHDPIPFHTTNGMFDPDTDGRDSTIGLFLRLSEFPPTRFLLRLEQSYTGQAESLEALILIQTAARRQRIARQLRNSLIRRFPFIGGAQEAHVTRLMNHKEVFERVVLLLATVILLLLLRSFPFGPVMHKRGEVAGPSGGCGASSAAKSSALRAGSSS
jgi:hypothetical protein